MGAGGTVVCMVIGMFTVQIFALWMLQSGLLDEEVVEKEEAPPPPPKPTTQLANLWPTRRELRGPAASL